MDTPDHEARLVEVLRAQVPHEGDRISRKVLRLFLRKFQWSFESYIPALVDLEERGWLRGSGEFVTTTAEGAKAFAADHPADHVAAPQPRAQPPAPRAKPPKAKASKRRR
jgi:hypothetical protein